MLIILYCCSVLLERLERSTDYIDDSDSNSDVSDSGTHPLVGIFATCREAQCPTTIGSGGLLGFHIGVKSH